MCPPDHQIETRGVCVCVWGICKSSAFISPEAYFESLTEQLRHSRRFFLSQKDIAIITRRKWP